jgi:hypothetical protein
VLPNGSTLDGSTLGGSTLDGKARLPLVVAPRPPVGFLPTVRSGTGPASSPHSHRECYGSAAAASRMSAANVETWV